MNNIKKARMAAGFSQKYVAASLGVAAPSVSNWESGKTSPTPENLSALADLFSVTIDYLLGREESNTSAITFSGTVKTDDKTAYNQPTLTNVEMQRMQRILNGMNFETPIDASTNQMSIEARIYRLSPERRKQALDFLDFLEQQPDE